LAAEYSQLIVSSISDTTSQMIVGYSTGSLWVRGGNPGGIGWTAWKEMQPALGYTPVNKAGDIITFQSGSAHRSTDGNPRFVFGSGGTSTYYGFGAAGQHEFTSGSNTRWLMNADLGFYSAGNVVAYWSDVRLKKDIVSVSPAEGLDRVLSYRVVDYSWNDKGCAINGKSPDDRERGLIAQEVQEVNAEAVCENLLAKDENDKPYFTLNEKKIIFDLIGAVQALSAKVEALEAGR
jgi:hypothetical protein